jgi:oligopeptide transport system substrate-binding protein
MKKILAFMLVAVLTVGTLAGCKTDNKDTGDNETEQTGDQTTGDKRYVVWNTAEDPKTFDPALNSASDGGYFIGNMFEGLTSDTSTGKIIMSGAKDVEVSEDGKTYTFTLREDGKWSDGQPVTAEDYVYSWLRVMSADSASEYGYIMIPHIKGGQEYFDGKITAEEVGLKAIDESTFQVELNYPIPYFLSLTAFYTYYPVRKDAVDKDPANWYRNPETFIGNGPFKLAEYKSGSHIIMEPSETYRDYNNIKIDGVKAVMINEFTTAHNAYLNGDVMVNEYMPTEEIPQLLASDPNFINKPQLGTYYYIFNMDNEFLKDVKVRKALALAIDRKKITENVTKAGEIPATGFIPSSLVDSEGNSYRTGGEEYGIDPNKAKLEEAKALLAEAGYPNGEGLPTFRFIYNTNDTHKKVAEAVQQMWEEIGVKIELTNQEWAVFQDSRHHGDFDIARGGWLGDYNDPMTMLDLWLANGGNNDAQWRYNEQPVIAPNDKMLNPEQKEFEELVTGSMLVSGKERDDMLRKADEVLIGKNMVLAPIYFYAYHDLIDSNVVEGIERTSTGTWIFKNAEFVD